jgi:hypothetical protein
MARKAGKGFKAMFDEARKHRAYWAEWACVEMTRRQEMSWSSNLDALVGSGEPVTIAASGKGWAVRDSSGDPVTAKDFPSPKDARQFCRAVGLKVGKPRKRKPKFGTPEWDAMFARICREAVKRREKHGFMACPKCGAGHTNKTLSCRKCEYKAKVPGE